MTKENEKNGLIEGMCPILDLPCPQGEESASECCLRYQSDFDPMERFRDFSILECATVRAARMRGATIKHLF
ncbi:MAG: hypothetical protein ACE5JB_12155 [bacterium]